MPNNIIVMVHHTIGKTFWEGFHCTSGRGHLLRIVSKEGDWWQGNSTPGSGGGMSAIRGGVFTWFKLDPGGKATHPSTRSKFVMTSIHFQWQLIFCVRKACWDSWLCKASQPSNWKDGEHGPTNHIKKPTCQLSPTDHRSGYVFCYGSVIAPVICHRHLQCP